MFKELENYRSFPDMGDIIVPIERQMGLCLF